MKKRNRFFCLTAAIGLVASLLAGCGSAESTSTPSAAGSASAALESTAASEEASGAAKVLRVGMECAYAPFNWTQTSATVSNGATAVPIYGTSDYAYGYDIMVAQMLADQLGWSLEVHKVDWSSIILGMNSGDYDVIIAGMGYTEERDKSVDFTTPYYIRNNVVVVKADSKFASATQLSELTGASATTQIGTTWEQYVPQIPEVQQLTYYETTSEVIMAVSTGTADCGVLDEPTAKSACIANPDLTYVKFTEGSGFAVPEGQSLDVCIAVPEGSAMKGQLSEALAAIGWNEEKMDQYMDEAITLQPLSN